MVDTDVSNVNPAGYNSHCEIASMELFSAKRTTVPTDRKQDPESLSTDYTIYSLGYIVANIFMFHCH